MSTLNNSNTAEASALAYFDAMAAVRQPQGTLLVDTGAARDHADMRAGQLSSLLLLIRRDDARSFRTMADAFQLDLLWLASQLADELKAVLPLVADEARLEGKA